MHGGRGFPGASVTRQEGTVIIEPHPLSLLLCTGFERAALLFTCGRELSAGLMNWRRRRPEEIGSLAKQYVKNVRN